jgi:5-methylcytosine-specific restriction enzyme subunit McrC
MNTLFEEYIGRTLQRTLSGLGYSTHLQGGRLYCLREIDPLTGRPGSQRFMTKPDILIRSRQDVAFVVDTKWKRLAPQIDDPKRGVSQPDVYQMMAYGRLYSCPNLMLLYPHHSELRADPGEISTHQVVGCDDVLTIATVSLDDLSTVPGALRRLFLNTSLPSVAAA